MAAYRIRRGIVKIGTTTLEGVQDIEWEDNLEFNRDKVNLELSGEPVLMNRAGSGSFKVQELPSGLASGYLLAATMSVVTDEVEVSSLGVETVTNTTYVFNHVTLNVGGDVDAEAPGAISVDFEYAYTGASDPDA